MKSEDVVHRALGGSVRRRAWGARLGLVLLLVAGVARADYPEFGPNDVPTVFYIAKSDDRNRVDYGIRLDAHCAAVNDEAVIPYWREFEHAPPVRTHPLNFMDKMGYGVAAQNIVERNENGGDYVLRLKHVDRRIGIRTHRNDKGRCVSVARTLINGSPQELLWIYVKLAGPLSVDYIDIHGRDPRTGKAVTERLKR